MNFGIKHYIHIQKQMKYKKADRLSTMYCNYFKIQNKYKLPTQCFFFGVTLIMSQMMKLHLNKPKFQLTCIFMGYIFASLYSDFKSNLKISDSDKIFD